MTTIQWPVLANQAAAGCLGGMLGGRQTGQGPTGLALVPGDVAAQATSANAFGQAFDAALTALYNADGSKPASLGNAGGLVQTGEAPNNTEPLDDVSTAAASNVSFSYPPAAYGFAFAISAGRGLTRDIAGTPFNLADWTSSGIAATAAAMFYEWIKAGVVSLA
jgi:hypothetical protein